MADSIGAGPRVRKAAAADLGAILEIESAWTTTPHWTERHFQAELDSETSYLCLLEGAGRVLGYASMKLIAPEAQVLNLAVRPDSARKGWGRQLMERLHLQARAGGCDRIALEVSEKNAPARRLYLALGYRIVGRRPKYYNDGADALLMEAPL